MTIIFVDLQRAAAAVAYSHPPGSFRPLLRQAVPKSLWLGTKESSFLEYDHTKLNK